MWCGNIFNHCCTTGASFKPSEEHVTTNVSLNDYVQTKSFYHLKVCTAFYKLFARVRKYYSRCYGEKRHYFN